MVMELLPSMGKSKSETQTQIDPMRRDQVVNWQNRYYGLLDQPFELYPDQMYAGMQPEQEEALAMREAYARGMGGILDPTMEAWRFGLGAPDVASNPYVQGMLEQQRNLLNRNLYENLVPGAEMGAIGAGQMGGSRQGVAEGIAARGTQEALAQSAAATQLDAYGRGLAQQQYALGYTPTMMSMGQMPAEILSGVGGARRAEEQLGLDEAIMRHQFEQEEPWQRYERFTGPYQAMSAPYTTTSGWSSYTPSRLQQIGQGVGIASMVGGMFTGGLGGGGGGGNPWGAQTAAPAAPAPSVSPMAYGGYGPQQFMPIQSFGFRGLGGY